jgi:transglycosylase-like protein
MGPGAARPGILDPEEAPPLMLTHRTRVWISAAVATLTCAVVVAPPLGAQTDGGAAGTDVTVASLRQQADAASGSYFAALSRYATLTNQINGLEAQLPALRDQEKARLRSATARAVVAYEGAGAQELGAIINSNSVLTAARQAQWLKVLNGRDNRALVELRRLEDKVRADEKTLRAAQQDAAAALAAVRAQGQTIEGKLTAAETRQRQLAAAAASAGAPPAAPAAPATPAAGGGGGGGAPASGPPPSYTPSPGQNPHHDDPFLTCVRLRESGGNYQAYNPAGPYMGAYQFLQSTWDGAANHIGRSSLIGVRPDQASPYDQDDVAWGLYQWQGTGPWGGSCP